MDGEAEKLYTEDDLRAQIKPLSQNAFARFFQRLYRKWLSAWYSFSERRAKWSGIIYKVFFFLVFSLGVTVWQYIVMTFLPYAFKSLNGGPWGWPSIPVAAAGGEPYVLFGDAQGLGYFIAFEIAVFTAQCINFPLQRNITFRSHGNPWYQALWYFIGWVLVSVFTCALWGICNCFLIHWGFSDAVIGIGKTAVTGLFSMIVFFFVFLVIFPDNAKLAKKAKKRAEQLKKRGASLEKIAAAEKRAEAAERRARVTETEKAAAKATSLASAKALRYFALEGEKARYGEEYEDKRSAAFTAAADAIAEKERAVKEYDEAKSLAK